MFKPAVMTLVLVILVFESPAAGQSQECVARGQYFGLDMPGSSPEIFAPGIASTQHHDDWIPVFSPSGREVVLRVNGKISGEIIGVLFWSSMDETGCWSEPTPLPFSGQYGDGAAVFSPDGSRIYFSSRRPDPGEVQASESSQVWQVDRVGQNWAEPVLLDSPVNQYHVNGGLSMAADGTLVVAMIAPMGKGGLDIYELAPDGDSYPTFEPVVGPINSEAGEVAPYIDLQKRFLIYTSYSPETGLSTLISQREADGSWGPPQPVPVINDFESKFVGLSPDGEILFFVSHRQVEESNPDASWSLDLFDDLAIQDNADCYWVSSQVVKDGLLEP